MPVATAEGNSTVRNNGLPLSRSKLRDLAVGGLDVSYVEVLVELDAHAAGNFLRFEFDLGDGGEGLRDRDRASR